ncbi:MAG TPA: flavodoxin family protein [Candidatus Methylomirabilis sp.]|nr:flavodoxin family protein [Candidatus Methylomirabilis sp.]
MAYPLKYSDEELMKVLEIDRKTLDRFKEIREATIAEAKMRAEKKSGEIKVLGVSGSARDLYDMAQEESNTSELLKKCLKYCQDLGAKTEYLCLRDYNIKYCKACYSTTNTQCHFYCTCYQRGTEREDDMSKIIYDKILDADVIIFATPVNNYKISTLMATFIDRCISLDGSLPPANPDSPKDKELNIKHTKFVQMNVDYDLPGSGFLRRFSGKIGGIITAGHEEGTSMAISCLLMTLSHFGMLFPPFNNMYAMSSVCNPTYADKPIVLGDCFERELICLAQNLILAAKLSDRAKTMEWKNDYSIN